MVYYRKYRPQQITDLDLPSVREKLIAVLTSKKIPHAFLFTGSKGLGKTSAARILAKAINCKTPKGIEPCNSCEICTSVTNGSNIDVLEIDAASNGGVDEIRSLRERVKFAPSGLFKKVYIIDEVHMLSTGAFNALLKTLEEPPEHVVFILATTELHKLPSTIVSRTFQINFEKPNLTEITQSLKRIVKGEKLSVESGVLEEVAKISDNAFRDAAKNLEELAIASKDGKINLELFESVFRSLNVKEEVLNLLKAYEKRDAKISLQVILRLSKNGADFKVVIERLVDHLRGLLLKRNGIESEEVDVPELTLENINQLLKHSTEAFVEMKIAVIQSLPLELMTVKYCILDAKQEEVGSLKYSSNKKSIINEKTENKKQKDEIKNLDGQDTELLQRLLEEMNKINKTGAALLRSAKKVELKGNTLTIVTPFPIHAERLRSDKVFNDLKKSAGVILGEERDIEVKVEN